MRRVNTLLLVLIILVDGYVVLAPLFPAVSQHWTDTPAKRQALSRQLHATTKSKPSYDRLVVPAMALSARIYNGPESQQYQILDKGIWRFQWGSTPAQGGNTVLVGHRFTYTNPRGIFYYLNKVKLGNEIGVFWNNKRYLYKVSNIKVVPPTDVAIESPSRDARLTLFTCTPLWLPKNRLVVTAKLETT